MNADPGGTAAIKLLTLNTHQGFGARRRRNALLRIRDALRVADADLVFLQEVGVAHGSETPAEQYEVLADSVWPQHAYGRNAVKTRGHHGNAVLSKYPIVSWENVDASVGASEPRGLLHCVLRVPGIDDPAARSMRASRATRVPPGSTGQAPAGTCRRQDSAGCADRDCGRLQRLA